MDGEREHERWTGVVAIAGVTAPLWNGERQLELWTGVVAIGDVTAPPWNGERDHERWTGGVPPSNGGIGQSSSSISSNKRASKFRSQIAALEIGGGESENLEKVGEGALSLGTISGDGEGTIGDGGGGAIGDGGGGTIGDGGGGTLGLGTIP